MADFAELGIKIKSDDIKDAVAELDRLENQSGKTERATGSLIGKATLLAGALGAVAATVKTVSASLSVTREFQRLNASLVTVTGSAEDAAMAMEMIRETAQETPFSVQQLTDAFVKLTALGLQPSEAALISYGNTASAMGKDLNQMIEAVADATTGEFERLKEFGIRASSEGDRVSFTFQNVTTTIGKNAQEIEGYLRGLGEVQFAGAMERQMDTLDGAISNFGDTLDNLLLQMGEAGLAGEAQRAVEDLTRVMSDPMLIDKATQFASAIVTGFQFTSKIIATLIIRFTDLGDTIGAYGAAIASALQLDFEQARAIIALREEELKLTDAAIEAIWAEKTATDELTKSKENAGAVEAQIIAPQGDTLTKEEKKAQKEAEERRKDLAERLEDLREHFASETELAVMALENRASQIDELEAERITSQEELNQLRLANVQEYEDRLTGIEQEAADKRKKIADDEMQARVDATGTALSNLSSLMISKNKQMFEVGKASAIAQTVISTYEGAQKAFTAFAGIPIIGPALGAAAAGAAILAGAARVNAIKSQSVSGGGGVSAAGSGGGITVGGGIPPIATPPEEADRNRQTRELRVTVEGDGPNTQGMRKFAENLAETIKDMGGDFALVVS